jgi:hypothetical protein
MTIIITHFTYTEAFRTFERSGIAVPSSMLQTPDEIERQIEYLLHGINPIELIQFSSFLNMICQSCGTDMTITRGIALLNETQLVPRKAGFANKILFHRENLLSLIGHIIGRDMRGTSPLIGSSHLANQQRYVCAILLNNDLLNKEATSPAADGKGVFLKDYFIREWPHYYISETSQTINAHRIVRYRYCYETILPALREPDRRMMENAIRAFKERVGVSVEEYLHVVSGLFGWFLDWPARQRENPPSLQEPKFGFDFRRIDTFYISSKVFERDPSFLKIMGALSKDIAALKTAAENEQKRERDSINGHNKFIRVFFDNPIFKISDDLYCILDLKFLLENVCGGLLWRLRTLENIQDFKSAYGHLMETYFQSLIKHIFSGAKITFGEGAGPDAIVEGDNNILVIEFTTEYYRFSSLYNNSPQEFIDDAYRILFNAGKEDPRSRNKNDKGKMVKLNDYLAEIPREERNIIPVLVTENLIGNPDLFNDCSGFFDKELADKKLSNLQKHPPIFLCLDDLEIFWGFCNPTNAVEEFAAFAREWIGTDKGPQFHSAASGICKFIEKRRGEARISNEVFANFFSPKAIYK